MAILTIDKFGPIKHISITTNKINFFIGPQSSGKSTIAKIISFCSWLEKECITSQKVIETNDEFVENNLYNYHRLKNYADTDSEFVYETDALKIIFRHKKLIVEQKGNFDNAVSHKTTYIPAERIVASVPLIRTFDMQRNSLRAFLFEWWKMAPNFTKDRTMSLPELDAQYYHKEENNTDVVLLGNGTEIEMQMASSGLQSIIPLYANIMYASNWIYEHEEEMSYEKNDKNEEALIRILLKNTDQYVDPELIQELIEACKKVGFADRLLNLARSYEISKSSLLSNEQSSLIEHIHNISHKHYSNIIIEEPELNVFPDTQVTMLYEIMRMINSNRDNLFITTHSPYVLYALNNCMLSYLVREKIDDDILEAMDFHGVPIKPSFVTVWELTGNIIEGNESIHMIQDEKGLIRDNYFDRVMGNVVTDFKNLLSLYE